MLATQVVSETILVSHPDLLLSLLHVEFDGAGLGMAGQGLCGIPATLLNQPDICLVVCGIRPGQAVAQRGPTQTLDSLIRMPVLWPRNGPVGVLDEDGSSEVVSIRLHPQRCDTGATDFERTNPLGCKVQARPPDLYVETLKMMVWFR